MLLLYTRRKFMNWMYKLQTAKSGNKNGIECSAGTAYDSIAFNFNLSGYDKFKNIRYSNQRSFRHAPTPLDKYNVAEHNVHRNGMLTTQQYNHSIYIICSYTTETAQWSYDLFRFFFLAMFFLSWNTDSRQKVELRGKVLISSMVNAHSAKYNPILFFFFLHFILHAERFQSFHSIFRIGHWVSICFSTFVTEIFFGLLSHSSRFIWVNFFENKIDHVRRRIWDVGCRPICKFHVSIFAWREKTKSFTEEVAEEKVRKRVEVEIRRCVSLSSHLRHICIMSLLFVRDSRFRIRDSRDKNFKHSIANALPFRRQTVPLCCM